MWKKVINKLKRNSRNERIQTFVLFPLVFIGLVLTISAALQPQWLLQFASDAPPPPFFGCIHLGVADATNCGTKMGSAGDVKLSLYGRPFDPKQQQVYYGDRLTGSLKYTNVGNVILQMKRLGLTGTATTSKEFIMFPYLSNVNLAPKAFTSINKTSHIFISSDGNGDYNLGPKIIDNNGTVLPAAQDQAAPVTVNATCTALRNKELTNTDKTNLKTFCSSNPSSSLCTSKEYCQVIKGGSCPQADTNPQTSGVQCDQYVYMPQPEQDMLEQFCKSYPDSDACENFCGRTIGSSLCPKKFLYIDTFTGKPITGNASTAVYVRDPDHFKVDYAANYPVGAKRYTPPDPHTTSESNGPKAVAGAEIALAGAAPICGAGGLSTVGCAKIPTDDPALNPPPGTPPPPPLPPAPIVPPVVPPPAPAPGTAASAGTPTNGAPPVATPATCSTTTPAGPAPVKAVYIPLPLFTLVKQAYAANCPSLATPPATAGLAPAAAPPPPPPVKPSNGGTIIPNGFRPCNDTNPADGAQWSGCTDPTAKATDKINTCANPNDVNATGCLFKCPTGNGVKNAAGDAVTWCSNSVKPVMGQTGYNSACGAKLQDVNAGDDPAGSKYQFSCCAKSTAEKAGCCDGVCGVWKQDIGTGGSTVLRGAPDTNTVCANDPNDASTKTATDVQRTNSCRLVNGSDPSSKDYTKMPTGNDNANCDLRNPDAEKDPNCADALKAQFYNGTGDPKNPGSNAFVNGIEDLSANELKGGQAEYDSRNKQCQNNTGSKGHLVVMPSGAPNNLGSKPMCVVDGDCNGDASQFIDRVAKPNGTAASDCQFYCPAGKTSVNGVCQTGGGQSSSSSSSSSSSTGSSSSSSTPTSVGHDQNPQCGGVGTFGTSEVTNCCSQRCASNKCYGVPGSNVPYCQ